MQSTVTISHQSQKWLLVVGTRPEIIKMAPLMRALEAHPAVTPLLVSTGQHRELAEQALADFALTPDYAFHVMRENQTLAETSSRILAEMSAVLVHEKPDLVVVQGDTTSTIMGALAAFYARIPVAHVEAGLRSGDIHSPYPEEMNRLLTTRTATWHFAPTDSARENLLRENVAAESIHVTGNTGIDAIRLMAAQSVGQSFAYDTIPETLQGYLNQDGLFILVTLHRRENFGDGVLQLCAALRQIADENPTLPILFPLHFNPNVRDVVRAQFSDHPTIHLLEPQGYAPFIWLMQHCLFIISDSGGILEEATILGKPIIVARDTTERPEAMRARCAILAGTETQRLVQVGQKLIHDRAFYENMANPSDAFGDGHAAGRIVAVLHSQIAAHKMAAHATSQA